MLKLTLKPLSPAARNHMAQTCHFSGKFPLLQYNFLRIGTGKCKGHLPCLLRLQPFAMFTQYPCSVVMYKTAWPTKSIQLHSVRSFATKPKKEIQQVSDQKEGGVTVAKKVVQAGKDVTYLGVIIVGLGITALMFFTVGKELFSSKSPNVVYTRALKRCKSNDEVTSVFGLPLKGYGEMTRRKRRRHVSHFEYEKDGVMHMRVKFYIEGPDKKGTVHCEVRENESGDLDYRYLFVEVEGYPPQTIILEDNR